MLLAYIPSMAISDGLRLISLLILNLNITIGRKRGGEETNDRSMISRNKNHYEMCNFGGILSMNDGIF